MILDVKQGSCRPGGNTGTQRTIEALSKEFLSKVLKLSI